jgi:enoyl-CoA hydratase/carnithine racemase
VNGIASTVDGAILRIVLDRPGKLNAVNTPMLQEITARLDDATSDSIRAVVITGAGRAFCAGGDLSGADTRGAGTAANDLVKAIVALPKPVVAGVHGPAAGFGCALALACDLVVASEIAFFQLAFTRVGLMPDGGATALLHAVIGRARTMRMAMLAEKVSAREAFECGMISHIVGDEGFDAELESVVQALACGPTRSYGWIKRALAASALEALPQVQALEAQGQQLLVRSADFQAGVAAFRSNTTPVFEGR